MEKILTQEDIKNILVLINRATLKGEEALGTASLQIKLKGLIATVDPKTVASTEPVEENTNKDGTV